MRALPVDIVRAFLAIVDNRGFTRAAEQLGRTQPTVSLQIRRLEELVGAPVFDNTARLSLTSQGRTLVERGRKFVAAHDELAEALTRREDVGRAVRFGMPAELASAFAPGLLDLARRRGGGFAFEIACEPSETLIARVRARELDVALAMAADTVPQGSVASWPLALTWIAAPRFQVVADAAVRLVTPPEGTLFYAIAADALARAGRRFEVVCRSANPDVLRSAVEAGYGVAIGPRAPASHGGRPGALASLAPLPPLTLGLFAREGIEDARELLQPMIDLLQASPALAA